MNLRLGLVAMAVLVGLGVASHASATDITGSIYFPGGFGGDGYDPSNGGVPPGYGNESSNTVAVGPGIEFGFQDTFNRDTADFSSTSLALEDAVLNTGASGWTQAFTADSPGFFKGLKLTSSDLPGGVTYGVVGDTLNVNWGGEYGEAPVTYDAKFSFASAAPEPSTWLLMFAGIGGIGLMLRRAKKTMGFRFKDALSA